MNEASFDTSLADVIVAQHRAILAAIEPLFAPTPPRAEIHTLVSLLLAHLDAEDSLVYAQEPRGGALRHGSEEHALLRYAVVRLLDSGLDRDTFLARLRLLRDHLVHHFEQEESLLVPRVARRLGKRRGSLLAARVAAAVFGSADASRARRTRSAAVVAARATRAAALRGESRVRS